MAKGGLPFTQADSNEKADIEEFWEELFARFRAGDVPEDFMRERPMNDPPEKRGIFDDEL